MATSRIEEVKPPQDAASALSQILSCLLNPASRPAELERVVVVGDLRVDRRQLVHLELYFVAIPERSGGHAGEVERPARREEERRARGAREDRAHGCFLAAAFARCCQRRGGFVSSRGGGGTRRGSWQLFKPLGRPRATRQS